MGDRLVRVFWVAALLGLAPFWAQAEEPIKIGAFFALSGPKAPIGAPSKLVAEMVSATNPVFPRPRRRWPGGSGR